MFGDKIVDATVPHLLQLREFLIEKHSLLVNDCFAVIMYVIFSRIKPFSNN